MEGDGSAEGRGRTAHRRVFRKLSLDNAARLFSRHYPANGATGIWDFRCFIYFYMPAIVTRASVRVSQPTARQGVSHDYQCSDHLMILGVSVCVLSGCAACPVTVINEFVLEVGGGEHKGSVVVVLGGQLRSGSHVNEILDLRQGQQQRFSLFFSHCLLFQHPPPPPPLFLLSSFPPLCSPSCLPPLSSVFERAVHMEGKPGHHHFF